MQAGTPPLLILILILSHLTPLTLLSNTLTLSILTFLTSDLTIISSSHIHLKGKRKRKTDFQWQHSAGMPLLHKTCCCLSVSSYYILYTFSIPTCCFPLSLLLLCLSLFCSVLSPSSILYFCYPDLPVLSYSLFVLACAIPLPALHFTTAVPLRHCLTFYFACACLCALYTLVFTLSLWLLGGGGEDGLPPLSFHSSFLHILVD